MRNINEDTITQAVIASFTKCEDARLRTVMYSLVQHLHAFARDVQLTEDEWFNAISFLTQAGRITDENRQEFILLSDALGLTMLVMSQNSRKQSNGTESAALGSYSVGSAFVIQGVDNGAHGATCYVRGQVRGADGEVVPYAWLDVWPPNGGGLYEAQKTDELGKDLPSTRSQFRADAEGNFLFCSILPEAYPIPHDGPVGRMLAATGRHPWRPAHLHFKIQAPGYETLDTQVFRDDDKYLDSDVVFGVRSTLITDWVRHEPGIAPDGRKLEEPWFTLEYDFVLSPSEASMIRHVVMWRVSGESLAEHKTISNRVKTSFECLRGRIPGIRNLEVGLDFSRVDYACDIVLVIDFESRQALEAYNSHPDYLSICKGFGDVLTEEFRVDYKLGL